jgi:hypothetical protein
MTNLRTTSRVAAHPVQPYCGTDRFHANAEIQRIRQRAGLQAAAAGPRQPINIKATQGRFIGLAHCL